MTATDPTMTALAHSWSALSLLHGRIEAGSKAHCRRRTVERTRVLAPGRARPPARRRGWTSPDATGRRFRRSQSECHHTLVTRLEERGLLSRYLCPTDRRGIYTDVTDAGRRLLEEARPTHNSALREELDQAAAQPALAPLVDAIRRLQANTPPDSRQAS